MNLNPMNEWLRFLNFNIKKINTKKLIIEELITFIIIFIINFFAFLLYKNKTSHYFPIFKMLIIIIITSWILSIILAIINKKIKSKFILFIIFILYPKSWAILLSWGALLYAGFFSPDYKFYIIISFFYLLSASTIFLPNDTLRKIKEITELRNNNLFNSLFLIAIFSYIIIGNSRYYIRIHGISQNGAFRLSTGIIIFSYYAMLILIANIVTWEEKNPEE